jgi:hypothetical protein
MIRKHMRRFKYIFIALLILTGACTPATKFIVTNIGYEPLEVQQSYIYALPQTNLITGIQYQKDVFLPGPYCDYALKLLGINGVNRLRAESYKIIGTEMKKSIDADPSHMYTLNLLEGEYSGQGVSDLVEKGFILLNDLYSEEEIVQLRSSAISLDGVHFKDVTMESNVEMKKETMYKTILTDTSFIRVPVVSEQLERKTPEKKAEEAAKLILEIRSDRYYLAAGIVDPFPQDFDLATALAELDELEEKYLSLFIGKSYTQRFYREYYIVPEGAVETEDFVLGSFSLESGFDAVESSPGDEIVLEIIPLGKTRSMSNLLPQQPEEEVYNKIYYRMPEITLVNLYEGDLIIHQERIAIFQSGAMVNLIK